MHGLALCQGGILSNVGRKIECIPEYITDIFLLISCLGKETQQRDSAMHLKILFSFYVGFTDSIVVVVIIVAEDLQVA